MDGKWQTGESKIVFESEWVNVDLVDIELPDKSKIDHYVVKPKSSHAAITLCHDPEKGVLVIWRHRFVNDVWTWELPAGGVEEGEKPEDAAKREMLEETGWAPKSISKMVSFYPINGLVELTYDCFFSEGADWVGPGRDINEAADVAWVSLDQLRTFMGNGEMSDGMSLTASLFAFQFGPLKGK